GRGVGVASQGHQSSHGLDDVIVSWPFGVGAVKPVAGQRHANQFFISCTQRVVGQPQLLDRAGPQIGDQRMRVLDNIAQGRLALRAGQVQDYAAFVAVQTSEIGVVRPYLMWADLARNIAFGWLYLDDVGPQVCQQKATIWPGQHMTYFHDAYAFQWSIHSVMSCMQARSCRARSSAFWFMRFSGPAMASPKVIEPLCKG